MKKLLFFAVIAFLLPAAFGMEAKLNKNQFAKGEQLTIDGKCADDISVEIKNESRQVAKTTAKCEIQRFSLDYNISFLDPTGKWNIQLSDTNSSQRLSAMVLPSRESQFLSMDFLSPKGGNFSRFSVMHISVLVKDAEAFENNASVFIWDAKGQKQKLESKGNGNYVLEYEVPVDANIGTFSLVAVSAKTDANGSEIAGAETMVKTTISHAQLSVSVMEPVIKNYSFGDPVLFRFKGVYQNGKAAEDANAVIIIEDEAYYLSPTNGVFEKTTKTENIRSNLLNAEIKVSDIYGNEGKEILSMQPVGYWLWFLKRNFFLLVIPILFVLYVFIVSGKQTGAFLKKKVLEHRKRQLETMLLKLQDDYYNKATVPPDQFRILEAKYSSELQEVYEKLRKLSEEELV